MPKWERGGAGGAGSAVGACVVVLWVFRRGVREIYT